MIEHNFQIFPSLSTPTLYCSFMPTVFFRLFSLSEGKVQITKMLVSIYLARKLDLHKFTRCKYGTKKCRRGESKSKDGNINAAFA